MHNRITPRTKHPPARVSQPAHDMDADEMPDETGETADVGNESDLKLDADTGFDRVVGADDAGLGGGLDQAEEAQLGVTDEELEKKS